VPSVKYRRALGREAILNQHTGLYLLMVGLSVALVTAPSPWGAASPGGCTGNATLISAGFTDPDHSPARRPDVSGHRRRVRVSHGRHDP
jgi:hypothetical protein